MRIGLASFVLAFLLVAPTAAQPATSVRASAVVQALEVDEQTGQRLLELLTRYDADLDKLLRARTDLKRRLVTAHRDAQAADKLLADWTMNQRLLMQLEDQLLTRARQILPGPKAVQLLMLISLTEPTHVPEAPPPPTYANNPRPPRPGSAGYDPNVLFPPGSESRPPCDPFASMHGCRY